MKKLIECELKIDRLATNNSKRSNGSAIGIPLSLSASDLAALKREFRGKPVCTLSVKALMKKSMTAKQAYKIVDKAVRNTTANVDDEEQFVCCDTCDARLKSNAKRCKCGGSAMHIDTAG